MNLNHMSLSFQIGDHIEKLDGVSVVGKRHYEVARLLKDIPTGTLGLAHFRKLYNGESF